MFSNKVYDVLKFIAQIALPAAGTAYLGLAAYWNLPNPDEVVGSVVVIDTLLGTLLGLSNKQYMDNDGNFAGDLHVVNTEDEGLQTMLAFNPESSPESLADQKTVTMKVVKH